MLQYLPQILIIVCIIAYVSIYLVGINKGRVKPVLATWLLFVFATILSFITNYKETGAEGLVANAFNVVDIFAVLIVFIVILFNKGTNKNFNKFEKICLVVVFIIFIVWFLSGQNILAHLSIQVILVVAYLPTLIHLWKAEKNTESLGMWFFDYSASMFGVFEPLRTMAFLPLVYSTRSVISTLAVIALIIRLRNKEVKNVNNEHNKEYS